MAMVIYRSVRCEDASPHQQVAWVWGTTPPNLAVSQAVLGQAAEGVIHNSAEGLLCDHSRARAQHRLVHALQLRLVLQEAVNGEDDDPRVRQERLLGHIEGGSLVGQQPVKGRE